MSNPLLSDRDVDFLLYEVLDVERLCSLPFFAEHSRETFDLFVGRGGGLARAVLLPSYRAIDTEPPRLQDGRVTVHPLLRSIYPQLVALGLTNATRPGSVGGQQLPVTVSALASAYLMAGNLSAPGYVGPTAGGGAFLEALRPPALRREFLSPPHRPAQYRTRSAHQPPARPPPAQ